MEMASKRTWMIADENECECVRWEIVYTFDANRNTNALEPTTLTRSNDTSEDVGQSNVYFLHDTRIYKRTYSKFMKRDLMVIHSGALSFAYLLLLCLRTHYWEKQHKQLNYCRSLSLSLAHLPSSNLQSQMKLYYVSTIFAFKCEFVFVRFFFSRSL